MANVSTITTNFNSSPYYDDYDETKNFHRILFNPSLAVQARELTQLQTILQKQVDRQANHLFKSGTIVSGGQITVDNNYPYVKIKDDDVFSNAINVSELVGQTIISANTGVSALILDYATGAEASAPNTNTLYVKYTAASSNGTVKTFLSTDTIIANNGTTFTLYDSNSSIGIASNFKINTGVLYAKENLIRFDQQNKVISRYTNTPSVRIGFIVEESIVTYNDDPTLLDPAQGAYNFAAPGADRFKLLPVLHIYDSNASDIPEDFIELLHLEEGVTQTISDKTDYNIIGDELARRTYEESGNYVVNGLKIRVREDLNDGTNGGYLTQSKGGNSNQLAIGVESGTALVFGYEVTTFVTQYTEIDKGIDYKQLDEQIISTNYGNYVKVNEVVGNWDATDGIYVSLYDSYDRRISNNNYSSTSPSGSLIGTALLKTLEYDSGTPGSNTGIYRAYLTDVKMSNGDFSSVKAIYYDNSGSSDAGADIYGDAVFQENTFDNSIFIIPAGSIKSLRDSSGNVDTSFIFKKNFSATIATTGTFSLSTGSSDEIFPYSAGDLNDTQKRSNFVVVLNTSANCAITGTVTVASGNTSVVGTGTTFSTQLNVGDKLLFSNGDLRKVKTITSNVGLTLDHPVSSSVSGTSVVKRYLPGDIIDMAGNGTTGSERTITVNSSTSLSFDLKETLSNTVSASILTNLGKTSAREAKKTIRRTRYVKIDTSTHDNGVDGPWGLGVYDVFKLNSVRKSGSDFSSATDGTDVTSMFTLDNGQRDDLYDHASLKLKYGNSLSAGDHLLICFDYFYHDTSQGIGYYSVDSYPIDDVNGAANTNAIKTAEIPKYISPITGITYDLRNCVDTRITKVMTATDAANVSSASTNPSPTTSLIHTTGGVYNPAPNENFTFDYSYYLPRKDLIVIDTQANVSSVRGKPSLNPMVPEPLDKTMALAIIDVAPYPSLPSSLASFYKRPENAIGVENIAIKRYTMRDIGVLDQRISNLEYYVSLSLLEQSTINTSVTDENGLDRFKNGIIVDPFDDHSGGDLSNPDYKIAIDSTKSEARPIFDMNQTYFSVDSISGLTQNKSIVSLPYSEVSFQKQLMASTTRNAAGLLYNYVGQIQLNPSSDVWIDTTTLPDLNITSSDSQNLANWQTLTDTLNAWQTQYGVWTTATGQPIQTVQSQQYDFRTRQTTTSLTTSSAPAGTRVGSNITGYKTQLGVSTSTQTQDLGNRVVDLSLVPYVRQQPIQFTVYGLKPNARVYAFFDSEDVNDYVYQTDNTFETRTRTDSKLIVNSDGSLFGIFTLPNNDTLKFRTGNLSFRLTDSPTNSSDLGLVTTSAEINFYASGVNKTVQDTILSTQVPQITTNQITQTIRYVPPVVTPGGGFGAPNGNGGGGSGEDGGPDEPIAETFTVYSETSPGVFVTKIDLYFATKHPTLGAFVELREVNSAGQITTTVLPYSRVRISSGDINTSDDSSIPTTAHFDAPIFLLNNTQYAFVIIPEGNNNLTSVWVSKLGETDILSGKKIVSQPFGGILFVSADDKTYSAVQDEDIKFTLYKAQFTVGSGVANFVNYPTEFINVANTSGNFTQIGEEIHGETRLTLSNISGGTIANSDIIVGVTSTATGTVTYANTTSFRVKNVSLIDKYANNESITVSYANGTTKGITGIITSITTPKSYLLSYDVIDSETIQMVLKRKTTATNYLIGEELRGQSSNTHCQIGSFFQRKLNLLNPQSSTLNLAGTSIDWETKSTSNTGILDTSSSGVQINQDFIFSKEKILKSFSVTPGTLKLSATLVSADPNISPIVDVERTHGIYVHNIINNDATGENGKSGGNAYARYISKKVTLDEGQDAEDLKVYVTGYKPPNSDILVYYKILNGGDSDTFNDVSWVQMETTGSTTFSDAENTEDFKEFQYSISNANLTGTNGEVQYTNSQGITFTGYKYLQIKIVLLGSDSANVPRLRDFRGICLQI